MQLFFPHVAGLFSSLTSHIVRVKFDYPRLLAKIRASAIGQNITETVNKPSLFRNLGLLKKEGSPDAVAQKASRLIPASLGASGAIYSAVTLSALAYPNADVQLLFPPITMPISWGVGGMVMLDILGILRGWRLFDHWAHLSGALFGLFYYKYGVQIWDKDRALCEVVYLESEAEERGGK
ncbi:hypothetical protein PNOK_0482200 [Pyrrhoderma noxium]|uniref:Peptidase S54 rhomboid domain-containing protein n=1 Tax=Pyrrhoderma noxium TaxID=2282107 RepID=A0A286UJZ5_9AGAM|nr:hypothetical protein PNOK_0482200 [Pyrrhoderma noxium]